MTATWSSVGELLRSRVLVIPLSLALVGAACAQPIYNSTPDWISTDRAYSTGADLVDLNRDGWLDLVVSNGNDMRRERVVVYYNRGDGTFPTTPDWQSDDLEYHGHLAVADVNGDGWPDVAVARPVNEGGPAAELYVNHGGTLSSLPAWTSNVNEPAFGVAFGDMNNDGRADLAVGTTWAYSSPNRYHNYVYLNVGGMLAATPGWTSADTWDYAGVCWVDADDDGWLDLALSASNTRSRIYRNLGGTFETTASWVATDGSTHDGIMFTAGDVTGDGMRDLVLADNNQLGGTGCFRLYPGRPGGLPATSATWTYADGYCSALALADLNCDGRLDLVTGAWWDYTRVFLNAGTGFGPADSWHSAGASVVERIVFGDVNRDGLRSMSETFPATPFHRRLFCLQHQPVQEVLAVVLDGQPLLASEYTASREHGWVTVGSDAAVELRVEYTVSSRPEMVITNWDDELGNYLYHNQRLVAGDANCDGRLDFDDINRFVLALVEQASFEAQYPGCRWLNADINGDGRVTFDDINPFVKCLVSGGCP